MTTILLVEEYVAVRRGLRLLLEQEPDLDVCGGATTLAEAIAGEWDPDVIVHGLLLPDGSGPEVVTTLRGGFPRAALLVLSRLDTPVYVRLALGAGASGYVLKAADPAVLIDAVRRVGRGESYVQPSLGAALASWDEIPQRNSRDAAFLLTRREQEVVQLLALGHTNAEVARAVGIALRTVETHRTHAMLKLGLHSRADLVRFAAEERRFDTND